MPKIPEEPESVIEFRKLLRDGDIDRAYEILRKIIAKI